MEIEGQNLKTTSQQSKMQIAKQYPLNLPSHEEKSGAPQVKTLSVYKYVRTLIWGSYGCEMLTCTRSGSLLLQLREFFF